MISRKLLLSAKPMLSTRGPVPHERRCIQSSTDQKKFKYLRKLLFTHYIKIRYSLRKSYFKSVQGRTVTAIYRCGKIFADCKVKKNNNTFCMKWKIIKKGRHSHWSVKKIYDKKYTQLPTRLRTDQPLHVLNIQTFRGNDFETIHSFVTYMTLTYLTYSLFASWSSDRDASAISTICLVSDFH